MNALAQAEEAVSHANLDMISGYFQETEQITAQHVNVWDINLYAPMIIVDLEQQLIFANEADENHILKKRGNIYVAPLPPDLMIANTAVEWQNKRWAMAILPLPLDKKGRISLLTHELFHVAQPQLNFALFSPNNQHLDDKAGRIYLRLELNALLQALKSPIPQRDSHVRAALSFRMQRYQLYPEARVLENQLELNEGLAEYTGLLFSDRTHAETLLHFQKSADAFLNNPTFVRSFAYQTIPLYGFLLKQSHPAYQDWHKQITVKTNLSDYFTQAFKVAPLNTEPSPQSAVYNEKTIFQEEEIRAQKKQREIQAHKANFLQSPHLEIPLKQTSISFDPRNIMPIPGVGTYYPNLQLSDIWGKLSVHEGVVVNQDRTTLYLKYPTHTTALSATGPGWTLTFSEHFVLVQRGSHVYLEPKKAH